MIVKQCAFIDRELDTQIGIHCEEDNGDEYIICLERGSIFDPSEILYYKDLEEWDVNWRDPETEKKELDYIADTIATIQEGLTDLVTDFGAITISTKTGEITINENELPVFVVPD